MRTLAACSALALLALALGSPRGRAQAPETFVYVVKKGDSCSRIALEAFGDRKRYDLIHQFNPGMGPPPHRLEPGRKLVLPRVVGDAAGAGLVHVDHRLAAL